MSKITLFLCAGLFAAAVDATYLTNTLAAVQQRVDASVAALIGSVEKKYEDTRKRGTERLERLDGVANDLTDRVAEDVKKLENKLEEDIRRVIAVESKGVDATECDRENERLHDLARDLVANATACIVDKKETANALMMEIDTAASDVLKSLSAIREESERCGDGVSGITSTLGAIACTKLAGLKAVRMSTRLIPYRKISSSVRIVRLLGTAERSLAYCASTHGPAKLVRESRTILENTRVCVQRKIEEARRGPTTKRVPDRIIDTTEIAVPERTSEPEKPEKPEKPVPEETTAEAKKIVSKDIELVVSGRRTTPLSTLLIKHKCAKACFRNGVSRTFAEQRSDGTSHDNDTETRVQYPLPFSTPTTTTTTTTS